MIWEGVPSNKLSLFQQSTLHFPCITFPFPISHCVASTLYIDMATVPL